MERETLRRRARLGVVVLIGRTVLHQFAVLGGNVYLARALGPGEFGAFWIVQFALAFFGLVGDVGLGAALVQQKEAPTRRELSTVWWAQMFLAIAAVVLVFAIAPWVVRVWPDLPSGSVWLMRALSVQFLLNVLRAMPAILLERELRYPQLSAIELAGTVVFYGSASLLAHLGLGLYALMYAALAQGVVSVFASYVFRPFFPSLTFERKVLPSVLKFGVAYQTKSAVGFLNAAIIPMYGGALLGKYNFGLVSWSQNLAYFPLKLVDIIGRVNFPLFSRLQGDRVAFSQVLQRSVLVCAYFTFLMIALFLGLGPNIVLVIYGTKWMPAVPTLYVFSAALSIGFLSPLVGGALDAVGRPQVMMRLGVFWTALNWVVVVAVMQVRRTAMAFSIAYCVHIVVGNLLVVWAMRSVAPDTAIWPKLRAGLVACGITALLAWRVLRDWATGPLSLIGAALVAMVVFATIVVLLYRGIVGEVIDALKPGRAERTHEAQRLGAVLAVTGATMPPLPGPPGTRTPAEQTEP